jgi:hypothetical protein
MGAIAARGREMTLGASIGRRCTLSLQYDHGVLCTRIDDAKNLVNQGIYSLITNPIAVEGQGFQLEWKRPSVQE